MIDLNCRLLRPSLIGQGLQRTRYSRFLSRRRDSQKCNLSREALMPREYKKFWNDVCNTIENQEAQEALKRLDLKYICGFEYQPAKYPCYEEYAQAKIMHADTLILMQVGQFYETQGLDSVVMAEYRYLNFMGTGIRAGVPMSIIQSVCDKLVLDGFRVAVYEEAKLIRDYKGYKRNLVQVVSRANPTLKSTKVKIDQSSLFDNNISAQIIGFRRCENTDDFDFYSFTLGFGNVQVRKKLKLSQIRSCLCAYMIVLPVFMYDVDPGDDIGKSLIKMIQDAAGTRFLQVLPLEKDGCPHFHKRIEQEFGQEISKFYQMYQGGQRCLEDLTMGSLGLKYQEGIPDLLDALLGLRNQVPRSFFRSILLNPPDFEIANNFRSICNYFYKTEKTIPKFNLNLTPFKFQSALDYEQVTTTQVMNEILLSMRCVVQLLQKEQTSLMKLLKKQPIQQYLPDINTKKLNKFCKEGLAKVEELLNDVQKEIQLSKELEEKYQVMEGEIIDDDIIDFVQQFLWQKEQKLYGCINAELIQDEIQELVQSREDFLLELLFVLRFFVSMGYKDSMVNFIGRFDNAGVVAFTQVCYLQFKDVFGTWMTIADKQNTKAYMPINMYESWKVYIKDLQIAQDSVRRHYSETVQFLALQDCRYFFICLSINIIGGCFLKHVQQVYKSQWCVPQLFDDSEQLPMKVHQMVPYYLNSSKQDEGYDVDLSSVAVLTGPNMSGKSTFLRSITSLVLLGNCGFMVPSKKAQVPFFDQILYLGYTSDSPIDDLSGFAQECQNLLQIINILEGRSFVCCDEFGRSTQAGQGASLLLAFVELLIKDNQFGVCATHYATEIKILMESNNLHLEELQFLKIDVQKEGKLRRLLTQGISYDSKAFEVATDFGVDIEVIGLAKEIYQELKQDDIGNDDYEKYLKQDDIGKDDYEKQLKQDDIGKDDAEKNLQ